MSEEYEVWNVKFPECELSDYAAALVDEFKAKTPGRYKDRLGAWMCPFLPEAMIVGVFQNGIVGVPSGPHPLVVTKEGLLEMHDFIRDLAEQGSPGFLASEETIPFYAALLLAYAPGDEDVVLNQPMGVEELNRDGIPAKQLIEVTRDGNIFDILAYVLDEEDIVSRLNMRIDSSNGEMVGFNLETTNVESVVTWGLM